MRLSKLNSVHVVDTMAHRHTQTFLPHTLQGKLLPQSTFRSFIQTDEKSDLVWFESKETWFEAVTELIRVKNMISDHWSGMLLKMCSDFLQQKHTLTAFQKTCLGFDVSDRSSLHAGTRSSFKNGLVTSAFLLLYAQLHDWHTATSSHGHCRHTHTHTRRYSRFLLPHHPQPAENNRYPSVSQQVPLREIWWLNYMTLILQNITIKYKNK